VRTAAAFASLACGLFMAYEIGVASGLLL
jgi:hypothetical protein